MKLLDCTLRDGGYYTAWDFPKTLVSRYLNAMISANVDIVELGLRNFPKEGFLGAHAYTTDDFLSTLDIPEKLMVGVMIDAKTILSFDGTIQDAIKKLFVNKNSSPVDLVRIAAHFVEVEQCQEIALQLSKMGYLVGLNLMQAGGRSTEEITAAVDNIASWNVVTVLYFADSLGNMDTKEVSRIFNAIKSSWAGDIGIHTHNNQGKALDNSIVAKELGVQWIDSTVLGMGRGAGNAATELVTLEFGHRGEKYNSIPLWKLVLDDFQPMQSEHGWGASLLYHFAASNDIHPTYVQNLLSDNRYSSEQIIQALNYIAPFQTASYNSTLLADGLLGPKGKGVNGKWNATNWCEGKEILIVGAGESVSKYQCAIESFIQSRELITLSLNIHQNISEELIDAYVAIDPMRLMLEVSDYSSKGKPLYTSTSNLSEELVSKLAKLELRDYGCDIKSGVLEFESNRCCIPNLLSLAYALSVAKVGGASKVWLVGFDGYEAGDSRQEEMINLLDIVAKSEFDIDCICLTPTTYPVRQGSIYAKYS